MREIRHFVRGAYRGGRQKTIDKHVFDDSILFVDREPENKHDPNAIAVFVSDDEHREHKIGYIGKDLAQELAPLMDAGHDVIVAWQEAVDNLEGTGVKLGLHVADLPSEELEPQVAGTSGTAEMKITAIVTVVVLGVIAGLVWWAFSAIRGIFS